MRIEAINANVEKHKALMLEAEKWLWAHPQTGYTEWQAHEYLKEKFENLGYSLVLAGNIPGFYTDIDTGKPGPVLCIMGELDALDIANHPQSVNGMSHSCGHHAQVSALLGMAAALKEENALEWLCGKIRLMAVPAEEMIQFPYREELRKKGIIKYVSGKVEFMYRGFFDDVDIAMMIHTNTNDDEIEFKCGPGNNGCVTKLMRYKGRSAHAGGAPHLGINAQYAAMLGMQACNDLRETFRDDEYIKFHPITSGANCAVNIIPDEIIIESYVRGKTVQAIKRENKKINRALAGAAAALGASLEICDRYGASPENHSVEFMRLAEKCCIEFVGKDKTEFRYEGWGTACSDFGDITTVMPGIQFNAAGALGTSHAIDFIMADPERFCCNSAKIQLIIADELLRDNAAQAKRIISSYTPAFSSIKEYLQYIDEMNCDINAVTYKDNGQIIIKV